MSDCALDRIPLDRPYLLMLTLTLGAAGLPHWGNIHPFVLGLFGTTLLWRLVALYRPALLPGRWLLALLAILGLLLALAYTSVRDGAHVGSAVLVAMLGLKLLEIHRRRDVEVALLLGYFVLFTQFLFRQDLWLAAYVLPVLALMVALQLALGRIRFEPVEALRGGLRLLLVAAPLAVALFVFFPRLDSPLWSIQHDTGQGITGISDHLYMGAIGELAESEEIAFRARFLGEAPTPARRYWRGPVLWRFDGLIWSPGKPIPGEAEVQFDPETLLDYELTMEPSGQRWIYALDVPVQLPADLRASADLQVRADQPVRSRSLYRLGSAWRYQVMTLAPDQRTAALQIPPRVSDKVRTLAQTLRAAHPGDDAGVVQAVLKRFHEQPFVYTLSPGVAPGDPVEHFLFESRRGFCEHYASSFALLMRLAGIPSRVVIGYQGGEYNPMGDHWIVRQSDAHAWNEVWLPDKGWIRVDPTAAVAPERIELGMENARRIADGRMVFDATPPSWFSKALRQGRWLLDAVDQGWYRWVLGFSAQRQQSLWDRLGLERLGEFAAAAVITLLGVIAALVLWLVSRLPDRADSDPMQQIWGRYRRRLQRAGLELPPWYGPRDALKAALARWPGQARPLRTFTRRYIAQRYGPGSANPDTRALRRLLRQIRLSRRNRR